MRNAAQGDVSHINEDQIKDHLSEMVCGTIEETLNAMLDAETDRLFMERLELTRKLNLQELQIGIRVATAPALNG
jgi:hypothetical protein